MRGVTPDIFYGTWVAAGNGDAGENPLVRHPGLNDCLTVYGVLGSGDLNSALAVAGGTPDALAAAGIQSAGRPAIGANIMRRGKRYRQLPLYRAPAPVQRPALRYAPHGRSTSEVPSVRIGRETFLRPAVV